MADQIELLTIRIRLIVCSLEKAREIGASKRRRGGRRKEARGPRYPHVE